MKKYVRIFVSFLIVSGVSISVYSITTNTNISNTNSSVKSGYLENFYDRKNRNAKSEKIKTPSPFWITVQIILYTVIFGAIAYFIVKWIVNKSGVPATEDNELTEVILTKAVGMGSYITILRVGTSFYLLGVSNENVNLIDKIDDKETIDYIELHREKLKPQESRFIDLLSFFPKNKNKPNSPIDVIKSQKDKLRKL